MDYLRELAHSILEEGTSPSILQDITLDRSDMEIRGAVTGLTMKEYDEQLRKLTAENFQLKLKIYFMDSRLSKMEGIQDKDLIKENVDLKVTNESQSKELESKQKLLYEASEAFEQLQQEHQEALNRLTAQFEKEKGELKVRLEALDASVRLHSYHQSSEDEVSSLNEKVESLEQQVRDDAALIDDLHKDLEQECLELSKSKERIEQLEEIEISLKARVSELEENLRENDAENNKLKNEILSLENKLKNASSPEEDGAKHSKSELLSKISQLEEKLELLTAEQYTLEGEHRKACATIKTFVRKVHLERSAKERLEEELKSKDNLIDDLRSRGMSPEYTQGSGVIEPAAKAQSASNTLEQKKEQFKSTRRTYLSPKLEQPLTEDLRAMMQQVSNEKMTLAKEVSRLRAREEPLKQACSVLTSRLEELAGFLDSLLTDRALLGLHHEQEEMIRKAVDESRELSRNLTLSLEEGTMTGDSSIINDQSLVISKLREQLSVLSQQVRERDIELSYCQNETTCVDEHDSDVLTIPHEIDESWLHVDLGGDDHKLQNSTSAKKKGDKSYVRLATVIGAARTLQFDASESEAWSEPDRSVSLARMGRIDSASITPLRLSKCANSSESSEETLNESKGKRPRSVDSEYRKQQAKIKHLEETNKTLGSQLALMEKKVDILNRLGGESGYDLLTEIQSSLSDLEETRTVCRRLKEELATTQEELLRVKMALVVKEEICKEHKVDIEALQSKNEEIILEYELRLVEAAELNDVAKRKICDVEGKLKEAENDRVELELKVVEIQKKVEDTKRLKTESTAHVLEATKHLDTVERIMLDAERDKEESERKVRDLQQFVECLRLQMNEKSKEVEMWAKKAAREVEETTELKRRLQEAERSKAAVELKVKEAKERIQWMECKLRELDQAMDQCDEEVKARIAEETRRGVEMRIGELRKDWVSRIDLENTQRKLADMEGKLQLVEGQKRLLQEGLKEREEDLLKKAERIETENRDLYRQLDKLKVKCSKIELEVTRLTNEKLQLEDSLRKAAEKQCSLLKSKQLAEEKCKNLEKQVEYEGACGAQAGVSSDLVWARNLNTSPDLGIESDQGRFSSLEHQDQRALLPRINSESSRLEMENSELKRRLIKMGQTLEETLAELATANHQKKQMEHAICKQLHKTHHILKKARINFEQQDSDSVDDR